MLLRVFFRERVRECLICVKKEDLKFLSRIKGDDILV